MSDLALLQEAYPSVEPKILRKAVMETATLLDGDPDRSEGGNGCVSPMAAFKTIFEMTGVLPVGEKGQEALLPPLFHEEVYLACNADLISPVSGGTPGAKIMAPTTLLGLWSEGVKVVWESVPTPLV